MTTGPADLGGRQGRTGAGPVARGGHPSRRPAFQEKPMAGACRRENLR